MIKKMTACVIYLENQKAKLIGFTPFSESVFKEIEINKTDEENYFNELADSMESTTEVLLLGPDEEKGNFRKWLLKHRRNLGSKLVAVIPAKTISTEIAKTYRKKYLH
ncbi:hypothetical protein [Leptospira ognonensis]|nr:hypothetical protein [Leptospira ognonensis]